MAGMSSIALAVADHIRGVRKRCVKGSEDFREVFDDLVSSGRVSGTPEELKAIKTALATQLQKGRRSDPLPPTKNRPDRIQLREATPSRALLCVDGYLVSFAICNRLGRLNGKVVKTSREGPPLDDVTFRKAHEMAMSAILAARRDGKRLDERRRVEQW